MTATVTPPTFARAACLAAIAAGEAEQSWWIQCNGGRYRSKGNDAAIELCRACEDRVACLDFAMAHEGWSPEEHRGGIFGGMTPAERARHRKTLSRRRSPSGGLK